MVGYSSFQNFLWMINEELLKKSFQNSLAQYVQVGNQSWIIERDQV